MFHLFNNEEENASQNAELRQRPASNSLLTWLWANNFSFPCLSFLVWGSGKYFKWKPKGALKSVMNRRGDWSNYHHCSGVQLKKVKSYVRVIPSSFSFCQPISEAFTAEYNIILFAQQIGKQKHWPWDGHMSSHW